MHKSLLTCFLSAAIPLLGAAGTSESMAWLAGDMERLGWTMDAQDALDPARELFLAGEQWRWLRQAAPAAFNPDEQDVPTGMDAHATQTSDIGCRSSASDPEQAAHASEISQDARWQTAHALGAEVRSAGLNPPPGSSNIATRSDAQSSPTAHSTAGVPAPLVLTQDFRRLLQCRRSPLQHLFQASLNIQHAIRPCSQDMEKLPMLRRMTTPR